MNTFNKEFFREQLTDLRKKHNFTQAELSSQLGISDKTYSRWETGEGEPDMASLSMLSDIFGVSPAVFFGRADTKDTAAVSSMLNGLEPSEMIQRAFELQFQAIRGLAQQAFNQKWWTGPQQKVQSPPNRVNTTDHSITAYADGEVYSMMYNGSDANISVSLMPHTDRYAWLTDQKDLLSAYLSLLGDPDMVQCLPWLMSRGFTIKFTADYLAKNTGISVEKAEELMERAAEQQIVCSMITHIGNREVRIYQFVADHMLTAVLTLAHLSLPNQEKNGHVYTSHPTCLNIEREETK